MTLTDEANFDMSESDKETLRFLYNARITLFNVRREHEWRIFFGAVTLIGVVDVTIITKELCLTGWYLRAWQALLLLLTGACLAYELEIQRRNRIDRIAMFQMHSVLCNSIKSPELKPHNCIRLPADHESDKGQPVDVADYSRRRIFSLHFLWAFVWQITVLLVLCLISLGIADIKCQ